MIRFEERIGWHRPAGDVTSWTGAVSRAADIALWVVAALLLVLFFPAQPFLPVVALASSWFAASIRDGRGPLAHAQALLRAGRANVELVIAGALIGFALGVVTVLGRLAANDGLGSALLGFAGLTVAGAIVGAAREESRSSMSTTAQPATNWRSVR